MCEIDAVIEVPRGGFVKRGEGGRVAMISPVPCPLTYGFIPHTLGGDGDPFDVVVLGRAHPRGATVRVRLVGAVRFIDAGRDDIKLIGVDASEPTVHRAPILAFFHLYAFAKRAWYLLRRRPGRTACLGWQEDLSPYGDALSAALTRV